MSEMMNIKKVGIIGAGTMGNGIAQVFATANTEVLLLDINESSVERGIQTIEKNSQRLVEKQKMSSEDQLQMMRRIQGSINYQDLSGVDLVIEAATENFELKLKILQQIDLIVSNTTIIATNTSSLSITKLAQSNSNPNRVIGMHFFNPVPVMSLVEIICGLQTDESTLQKVLQITKLIGKEPISVKNSPGFVVNRILVPMINEAFFVLAEGLATAEEIDAGMKLGCNQPIGPLALADLIGLDTCLAIMEIFFNNFKDSKYRPAPLLCEMVAAGYLGRKTGRGVYVYS
jgi:3-hydroxybutyryl-CoA dehydrogenase